MITLSQLMQTLERYYPRALAEPWDSVGVISGDWSRTIQRILIAVDIDDDIVLEAQRLNCQAIVSHHPLFLPRHSVIREPYKLRTAARASSAGIALVNAHTNADSARPGVTDVLCEALGIGETDALVPTSADTVTGIGRIGRLSRPMKLSAFAEFVSQSIGDSHAKFAGDPQQLIETIAVCGGAGDSLLEFVRSTEADVFITSDLRHHPVAEHFAAGGCAVIDIDHGIAESLWLKSLQVILEQDLAIEVVISQKQPSVWSL